MHAKYTRKRVTRKAAIANTGVMVEEHPSDVPIQREQLPIGGQAGADLRGLHTNFDRGEQLAVVAWQR